jgi:hypothetical protein
LPQKASKQRITNKFRRRGRHGFDTTAKKRDAGGAVYTARGIVQAHRRDCFWWQRRRLGFSKAETQQKTPSSGEAKANARRKRTEAICDRSLVCVGGIYKRANTVRPYGGISFVCLIFWGRAPPLPRPSPARGEGWLLAARCAGVLRFWIPDRVRNDEVLGFSPGVGFGIARRNSVGARRAAPLRGRGEPLRG